ncbi:hypothetical protein NHE_0413 [Neorickettsia helminthoeca str. Oregon]|uniref:Uncharacterized protein n=1 Tax=Neorickettsia helminthoeca str. Oregon TaxID=1286528 RepID=X5HLQ7_9RICK|nr:hypothetical protein [Neorickettsia helminthoeca]AHX11360.1 hypothetical protein NHE_0413 [Neorickettsia helminthoeca str. Oregon]
MKKLELVLSQFDRGLISQYGGAKFLIYYHWKRITNEEEILKRVSIKKILYAVGGQITVYVCAENPGVSLKLHYRFQELVERVKLHTKIGAEIKMVLTR